MNRAFSIQMLIVMLLLSACGPAATPAPTASPTQVPTQAPTTAPQATPAATATAAPTAAPAATFAPTATTAPARTLTWRAIAVARAGPPARYDHSLTYDANGKQLVVFGGRDQAGRALGDTWVFDLGRNAWREVTAQGPAARFGHAAAYDPAGSRVIIFGGQATSFFNDVWAFDAAAGTWRQIAAQGDAPQPRYGLPGVIDKRGRLIVSHGFTDQGRFDDTWALDLATATWTNITPTQGTLPLKRCLHDMVYDAASDRVLLFGGCSSGFGPCPQGDLWALDLAANQWTQLQPGGDAPAARSNPALVLDTASGQALLFGGLNQDNAPLSDLWALDTTQGAWAALAPETTAPAARRSHDADATGEGQLYVFGGIGADGPSAELWELTLP
jgi:N-acetylneuraminic acid mutarotase